MQNQTYSILIRSFLHSRRNF